MNFSFPNARGLHFSSGAPLPLGCTLCPNGHLNFSIISHRATQCTLVLFDLGSLEPFLEVTIPENFRIGDVYCISVSGLDPRNIEYGYRIAGPEKQSPKDRFDPSMILLDPYAKKMGGKECWGAPPRPNNPYPYRARVALDDFDWEDEQSPQIPMEDLVIYELHPRGFTQHPSAKVQHPGTFAGITEKIPHLKKLGINAVELLPIFEFDELDNRFINPENDQHLLNYWGYDTIAFFAPKSGYAASGVQGAANELKKLIKDLHAESIEIILDIVLNHTAEGPASGPFIKPTLSLRGIDHQEYYILNERGDALNFSGVGNTFSCNSPRGRSFIIDVLRHWVAEYHIDGFRFDLASILIRDTNGAPLKNPPILEDILNDPILSRCKLIAEPWDAAGLYLVGKFPASTRWAEWNGQYRDTLRRFLRGEAGQTQIMAQRLMGSPDLYATRGPNTSINHITCHDGFTLRDLFSYEERQNTANGEEGRDGHGDNISWNCGVDGPSDHPKVHSRRLRLTKNAIAILMLSQGIPMLLMGDEVARTQGGNNNAYCHDDERTWMDWTQTPEREEIHLFFQRCIAFRRTHPILRRAKFLSEGPSENISWHGLQPNHPDHSNESRVLAFTLNDTPNAKIIYVAMNMHWEEHRFFLPPLPRGKHWHRFADTSAPSGLDACKPGDEMPLRAPESLVVHPRSMIILAGKPTDP